MERMEMGSRTKQQQLNWMIFWGDDILPFGDGIAQSVPDLGNSMFQQLHGKMAMDPCKWMKHRDVVQRNLLQGG